MAASPHGAGRLTFLSVTHGHRDAPLSYFTPQAANARSTWMKQMSSLLFPGRNNTPDLSDIPIRVCNDVEIWGFFFSQNHVALEAHCRQAFLINRQNKLWHLRQQRFLWINSGGFCTNFTQTDWNLGARIENQMCAEKVFLLNTNLKQPWPDQLSCLHRIGKSTWTIMLQKRYLCP